MRYAYICSTVLSSALAFLAAYFWYRSAVIDIPNRLLTVDQEMSIPPDTMAALQASAMWSQRGAMSAGAAAIIAGVAGLLSLAL
jgi:hypothetical protein